MSRVSGGSAVSNRSGRSGVLCIVSTKGISGSRMSMCLRRHFSFFVLICVLSGGSGVSWGSVGIVGSGGSVGGVSIVGSGGGVGSVGSVVSGCGTIGIVCGTEGVVSGSMSMSWSTVCCEGVGGSTSWGRSVVLWSKRVSSVVSQ